MSKKGITATKLEQDAYQAMLAVSLPEPRREYIFARPKLWRFDFAWPDFSIAFECEGGTWSQGAHVRGLHVESDCHKYNTAQILGWQVIRATTDMIKHGSGIVELCAAFTVRGYDRINQATLAMYKADAAAYQSKRSARAAARRQLKQAAKSWR